MEKSGFFDTKVNEDGSYDRAYLASSFAAYFASFIGNGVFANRLNTLQVVATTNMTVKVKSGQGWINGYWYENSDDLTLTIDNASGIYNRYDAVVLQLSFIDRAIKVVVREGVPSSAAQPPSPLRNSDYFELVLAHIYVPKGATNIPQQRIVDKRADATVCGFVSGVVDQIDTSEFYTQLNGFIESYINKSNNTYNEYKQFLDSLKDSGSDDKESFNVALDELSQEASAQVNALIDEIRGLLDGDVATNLQNQIDKINQGIEVEKVRIDKLELDSDPVKRTFIIPPEQVGQAKKLYNLPPMIPGHSYSLIAYSVDDEQQKVYVAKRAFHYTVTSEMTGSYLKKPTRCIEKVDDMLIDKSTFDVPESAFAYDVVAILGTELLSFTYFYLFKSGDDVVEVSENSYEYGLEAYDGLEQPGKFFGDFVSGENAIEFPQIVLGIGHDNKYLGKKINIVFSDITDKGTIVRDKSVWNKISGLERHSIAYSYAMALMALEGVPKMSLSDSTTFTIKGTRSDGLKVFSEYGFSILIFRNIAYANDLIEARFGASTYDVAVLTDKDVKEAINTPQMSVPSLFGRMKLIWSSFQAVDTKTVTVNISVNQNWAEPPDPSEYTVVIREYPKVSPYTGEMQDGNWFQQVQG